MYRQDIQGSMAHAAMLAAQGILTQDDCDAITAGLEGILNDLDSGALAVDMEAEDSHMFVEAELCLLYTSLHGAGQGRPHCV